MWSWRSLGSQVPGQWRRQEGARGWGQMPPKILSCPPSFPPPTFCEMKKKWANFLWNHEKMGIFLYEVVKTDVFLRVLPPWSGKNKGLFEGLAPLKNVLPPTCHPKILMLAPPLFPVWINSSANLLCPWARLFISPSSGSRSSNWVVSYKLEV